jgi:hypothetical protein
LVLCLCVLFLFTFTSLACIMPSLFMSTSLAYNLSTWCSILHLTFITTPSHLHGACFYITCASLLFLHHKCSYFPLTFFYIILFFCVNLLCSWSYFINFCVQFVYVSKFLGFFYLMCCISAICLNFKLHFLF